MRGVTNGRDEKSHLYKHSQESNHSYVALSDFKIIGSNFRNQKPKRKIAESLLIRETRLSRDVNCQHARDVNSTKTFYIMASGNYLLKSFIIYSSYFGLFNTNFEQVLDNGNSINYDFIVSFIDFTFVYKVIMKTQFLNSF